MLLNCSSADCRFSAISATKTQRQRAGEIAELRAKIESIENSRESLTLLLNKVLELEKKLNEQKNARG